MYFSVHSLSFRLVRACLGPSSIAERKLESGNPLIVLGIKNSLDTQGATFAPSEDKRQKWIARMRGALANGRLHHGEASKLAGALQWATQRIFRRMGRTVLRSIMAHTRQVERNHGAAGAVSGMVVRSFGKGYHRAARMAKRALAPSTSLLRCAKHATKSGSHPF